ncbi:hypothetical protein UFOVP991_6 [uncultured Caudovirales phage]|uniref:Uncharacterized protein n=1 Tax=uncultured Caudovirales phage TaxID=2100421 RepID=A0A6J5SCL9_9CAUD|nr:hypothetical protein UFOVP991_6 [uncultured Caudovirales phage]CAB4182441.1 hypothetical protein UFOVP1076_6 [uncultured Caudovirales phage]CAB4198162.1 hypothetical protein UFOVP1314_49 [uncultured Caudovirales phage]CAB4211296.1 hypothetical protein UFOVP1427_21 [uncultured Caudovirales phage]CAB5237999.1 hypothetical protein UFOVP1523_25 [uncultured Caudovirales phage]
MSATKSVINAESMARLKKDTKFAMKAKTATNQFNNFSGPPGRYFARLQRLDFRFHKNLGHPCFTFYHTCLAQCPDSGSDTNIVDQSHAGEAMKVFREVKVSEKMTQQDAWDAAFVDLQAYDVKTREFGMRNGSEVQDGGETFWKDLGEALDALQDRRPSVIIDVSAGKPQPGKPSRNFVNVRETVSEEVVSRFASPQIEVSDDDMQIDEEEAESQEVASELTPDEQIAMLMGLSREALVEALQSQNLDYPWANMSLDQLQSLGRCFVTDQPLPDASLFAASVTVETTSDEEEEESSDEEEEEEEEEAIAKEEDLLMKLQNTIANENRDQLKTRLRGMAALLPEDKFKKEQTDDFLRQWIVDVYTGRTAPAGVAVPNAVPF